MEYQENKWYREGALLYTVRPCIFAGKSNWENNLTLRVEGNHTPDAQIEHLAENLLRFLNGETSC